MSHEEEDACVYRAFKRRSASYEEEDTCHMRRRMHVCTGRSSGGRHLPHESPQRTAISGFGGEGRGRGGKGG